MGKKERKEERSRTAGQIFEAFLGKRPLLLLLPSSAEWRAGAGRYCAHCEAGRNVWPALWETALQGPQLSQPGDLNSATEFNGEELAEADTLFTSRWRAGRELQSRAAAPSAPHPSAFRRAFRARVFKFSFL